jgi:hypothetical protein
MTDRGFAVETLESVFELRGRSANSVLRREIADPSQQLNGQGNIRKPFLQFGYPAWEPFTYCITPAMGNPKINRYSNMISTYLARILSGDPQNVRIVKHSPNYRFGHKLSLRQEWTEVKLLSAIHD